MEMNALYNKFTSAQWWNACAHTIYKILYAATTITFFKYLSVEQFAQWASIQSSIFLLLLWLDFGMRKSVPRFAPTFAHNQRINKNFIWSIIGSKIIILLIATPLLYSYAKPLLKHDFHLTTTTLILFVLEGIISVLRLIYHAYFLNKQFNLLNTLVTTITMSLSIGMVMHNADNMHLIPILFALRIAGGIIILAGSLIMLKYLFKEAKQYEQRYIDTQQTTYAFVRHSGAMWITTLLKSLTERNFLVPLFAHTLGPSAAGMFKVANDGALIFYRIVIKTIGSTDTSLLAHAQQENKKAMNNAFTQLATRVAALCFPLFGILFLCFSFKVCFSSYSLIFNLFIIMSSAYLIETLLLVYERWLEVERAYTYIGIAYVPYVCMVIALASGYLTTWIGLISSIALIHTVRLVSLSIMALYARMYYKVTFPIRFVIMLGIVCGVCIISARLAAPLIYKHISYMAPEMLR